MPGDPVECLRLDRTVRTAWQEVAENSVDMAHFVSVHGTGRVAEVGELTIDGPLRAGPQHPVVPVAARASSKASIESRSFGPGLGVVTFTLMGTVTMVSDDHTDRRQ